MSSDLVEVFILSYNRPQYICEAIDSILNQDYSNIKIIVSDNSTNDIVENILSKYKILANLEIRRRNPSLSSINHFNKILSEVSSDYFAVFHDDDIMKTNLVSTLLSTLINHPEASAAAGNSHIILDTLPTDKKFASQLNYIKKLRPKDIAQEYLNPSGTCPPFPGYLYRANKVKNTCISYNEGRKHSDASFLLKIATFGDVIWIPDILLSYRKHSGNDSNSHDLSATLSLARFFKKQKTVNIKTISNFKYKNMLLWLIQEVKNNRKNGYKFKTVLIHTAIKTLKSPHILFFAILKKTKKFIDSINRK